jgi:hypothetical protein
VRVVLAGEYVTCSAHIRGKLIDFIKGPVNDPATRRDITEVQDGEVIGFSLAELWIFKVSSTHPIAFFLKPTNQMGTYKSSGSAD